MHGLGEVARFFGYSLETFLAETTLLIHGTTVATNTLVERKGAKAGLITTEGFRDLLKIREGFKEDRYNLRMSPPPPLIPRYLRLTVPERVRADGRVERPLDLLALETVLDTFAREGVESVAVCLLFSYLHPVHEREIGDRLRARFPGLFVSLSHEILPQIKEYDRLSATAVNAYVGPVYARYLEQLAKNLNQAAGRCINLLTMKSNGGVTPAEEAMRLGVQAILSGPAGGVSGAAAYGRLVGESHLIGFDMGGTSTDISLIEDGSPHIAGERYEDGWKIALPMIDMHTLGAGGGSITWVDEGGKLRVGPESAGARPGPACYGAGGDKATVTDADVVLGYLDPARFLNGAAPLYPDRAKQAIHTQVAEPLALSTEKAACGVLDVVTTAMAEGIRLLSARRGVDPRRFALLAFGGASGLHIGKVARYLDIGKVYLPAAASVLSACGMLTTDLKYDFSHSYTASLDRIDLRRVWEIVHEMAARGRAKLHAQGFGEDDIVVSAAADMRYLDQVYEVTVPLPDLSMDDETVVERWAGHFHRRYEELFSYRQQHQEIRLTTLRVTTTGRLSHPELPQAAQHAHITPALLGRRQIYTDRWTDVPVYDVSTLGAGVEITGPALLEATFTTILVEPGDRAVIDALGGIVLYPRRADAPETEKTGTGSDPITRSIVEHRLESVAREMAEVMIRTSMSLILNSSRDFSTAITDAGGQLVAQGEGIPVHISALPPAVEAVRRCFGDDMHEGDIFLVNDPYHGGSHLPDLTAIYPIFYKDRLCFFAVNRAHHSDIGGGTHGGYNPSASEIYHEGLRIPPIRLYEQNRPRQDILQMLAVNVRHSENFLGDLYAQIGSVHIAGRRLQGLLDDLGTDTLMESVEALLDGTERRIRRLIAGWPDGVYHGETRIDDDGFGATDIPIRAKVTIRGDRMEIDLSDSSPQVTGFINSSYANTRSLAHVAIMYLAPSDIPKNEGSIRPISVIAPTGLIVNPNPPAPVCMSTNHCGEEIVEAVFKALAPIAPAYVNAGFSRRLRYAVMGRNPSTGKTFIWHFFFGRGGGGASQGHDGWACLGEINVAGAIRSPSVEITEERFPFYIVRNDLCPGSGGDGQWRGGLGATFEMVYEGTEPAKLNTAGDGAIHPPFGLFGGQPGKPHRYRILSNGVERVLRSKETGVILYPGDRILVDAAGGGGYGHPGDRSVKHRAWDEKNGYV